MVNNTLIVTDFNNHKVAQVIINMQGLSANEIFSEKKGQTTLESKGDNPEISSTKGRLIVSERVIVFRIQTKVKLENKKINLISAARGKTPPHS